jgi:hypothetical protein
VKRKRKGSPSRQKRQSLRKRANISKMKFQTCGGTMIPCMQSLSSGDIQSHTSDPYVWTRKAKQRDMQVKKEQTRRAKKQK